MCCSISGIDHEISKNEMTLDCDTKDSGQEPTLEVESTRTQLTDENAEIPCPHIAPTGTTGLFEHGLHVSHGVVTVRT